VVIFFVALRPGVRDFLFLKATNSRIPRIAEILTGILGQLFLAGFQTTFVFFRLVEAFNCFISTPAHFSSKNNARTTDTRS
jgi:hypothetical protein